MFSDHPTDPIEQQLREELLGRTWAVHLVTNATTTDIADPDVTAYVAATAGRWAQELRDPSTGRRSIQHLARVLWPTTGVPDPADGWWRTPLGVAMRPGVATQHEVAGSYRDQHEASAEPQTVATNRAG